MQNTLRKPVKITGKGVHKGKRTSIVIKPSNPNTGVNFWSSKGWVGATVMQIEESISNTTIRNKSFKVETVEHLLSCLYGLNINNALIEMRGDELPIGDGSAKHFYDAITSVGVVDQKKSNRIKLCITKKTEYSIGKSSISIEPADELVIDCSLDWHPNIKGRYVYTHNEEEYKDIAYARTFAERTYFERLKKEGRAKGGILGVNTIDIDKNGKSTEYVRHKILDILGDLSLLFGFYIQGKVVAVNSGHKLHHQLVRGIIDVGISVRHN